MRTPAPLPSPLVAALLASALIVTPAHAEPPPAAGPLAAAPPAPDDGFRALRFTGGVSLTGIGLLGVVLGSVLGVRAIVDKNAIGAHCDRAARCDLTGYTLGSEAQDFAKVSTVVFAGGLVGMGAGLALFLTALPKKAHAAAWITPTPRGISLGARW